MLSFEDFFAKKKINLVQFQIDEPALFAEFSKHYPLMGEKSFDHTKKYWFNNLRRSYPLAQEIKPHAVKAEAISEMAVQAVAVAAAQNLDGAIDKPKFKEDHLAELVDENVSVKEVSLAEEEQTIIENQIETPVVKQAFKPRFNAKDIKKPEVAEDVNPEKSEEIKSGEREPAKAAFKPRFNMQNIKKEVVKEASEIEGFISEPKTKNPKTEQQEPKIEEAKPFYKPRFQMKNLQKPAAENQLTKTRNRPPETEG